MVSKSNKKSRYDRGGNNSIKKSDISKGLISPVNVEIGSTSLRRSTRGVIPRKEITSALDTKEQPGKESTPVRSNTRKSANLPKKGTNPPVKKKLEVKASASAAKTQPEKKPTSAHSNIRKSTEVPEKDTPPPAKRKLEVLEREKVSPSPLRRSNRGKKQPSLMSSDTYNDEKVTVVTDVSMKKQKKDENLKELAVEAKETSKEANEQERPNGRKRKTANARTFKHRFRQQDLHEDLGGPEKLSQDDKSCFGVGISKLPKVGQDGAWECGEKIEKLCVVRDCEGQEQSTSKLNDVNAHGLRNPGKLEMPCLNSVSQENGINALNGSKKDEEIVDGSEKLQVVHASVVELQRQEGEVSTDSNVVEGAVVASSSSSERELQVAHSSVVELQHQEVEISPDSNVVERTVVELSSSSEGELQVVHSSVVELQHQEVEIVPDSNIVEGTLVASSSSSEGDNDTSVRNCASCKRRRLTYNHMRELCSCGIVPIRDLQETFISENGAEHAQSNDFLDVDVNDGNMSTQPIHELDDEMMVDATKFVEYWVPVSMSNVQLEQYCATLLSNSTTLRTSWSKDIVGGALQDILISTKKSCDHPYSQESKLEEFLTKDLLPAEYLDVGIKASGKLQFLDILLSEIRSRGQRVLILYQSRSAGSSTGDILDDFLRQRFGSDSYERVEKEILRSKKQAALNQFNDKDSGRYVFLLEKRACSPTVKLSAVNAVVVFDSDWNLMNDNRALHKLSMDSSPEPLKIFRLYTSCTLEEKVLDLATNHVSLDSNLQNISRTTSHMLLTWGASYLFRKLDGFHGSDASQSEASLCSDISMLKDVADELLGLLTHNAENSCETSLITEVQHNGVKYSKKGQLFGQSKVQTTNGKEPHLFWNEILERKNPRWRFLSGCSQRNRKRAQNFGDLPEKPDNGPGDLTKKQKKILNHSVDAPPPPRTRQIEGGSGAVSPKSTASVLDSSNNTSQADSEKEIELRDVQKNLHGPLKSTILELSKILQLPENVKAMGEIFLEYIVDNHHISREPSTILQAFQISLIWIAASLLRYKVDKKQSLDVAKKKLGFHCTEEEVDNVHSKLRRLKDQFKENSGRFKEFEPTKEFHDDRKIRKICKKRKTKLLRKHEKEIQEFNEIWKGLEAEIEKRHMIDSAIVRKIHHNQAVRSENLKTLDEVFANTMAEHKRERDLCFQKLGRKHVGEIAEEDQKAKSWLNIKSSGGCSESEFFDGQENIGLISGTCQTPNRTEMTKMETTIPVTTAKEKVGYGVTIDNEIVTSQSLCATVATEAQVGNLGCPSDVSMKAVVSNLPPISEQISDEAFCAREEDATAPHKFRRSAKSSEASDLDVDSNKVNKEMIGINIFDSESVENCTDDNITDRENVGCGVTTDNSSKCSRSLGGTVTEGAPSDAQEANVSAPNEVVGVVESLQNSIPDGGDNTEFSDTNLSEPVPVENSAYAPSDAQEANVTAPNEVVGVVKSLQTSIPDGGDKTEFSDTNLSEPVLVENSAYAPSDAQEANVPAPNKVVGVVKSLQTSIPDGGDNTEFSDTNLSDPIPVENSAYALSDAQEANVIAPNEVVGVVESLQTSIPDGGDNTEFSDTNLSDPVPVENSAYALSDAQEANVTAPNEVVGVVKSLQTSIPDGGDNTEFSDTNLSDPVPVENSAYAPSYAHELNVTASNEVVGIVKSLETSNPDGGDNTEFSDTNLSEPFPVENSAYAPSYAQELNVTASNEVVGVVKSLETSNPDGGDNTKFSDTNLSESVPVENTTYASGNTRHECHRPLAATSILDGDATSFENTTNVLEQAELEQLHLISAESRQADSCAASLVSRDGDTRADESCNVMDVTESWTPFAPSNPELTELQLPHVEHLPALNREQSATQSEPNMLPPLPIQIIEEVVDRDGSQMGTPPSTVTPVVGFGAHHPSGPARQVDLRAQSQFLLSDPLKFEMERLRKESEKATKCFEDAKQELKSKYEKEKEEVIAELRRKYVTKLKSADAEYLLKKKELDANHNKVFMNSILAEAFNTKCFEAKPSVSSGKYEVPSTNFLHQLLLLSAQPRRTSAGSGSPNYVPPVASQQTAPSLPAHPSSSPAIGSMQMRPPHMLPNTRPISNFPISGEIRARNFPISGEIRSRAPHFRPALPTAAPSFFPASQGLPVLNTQRHHHFTTGQILPRLPTQLPPQQLPTPSPHTNTMGFQNPSVPAVGLFNGENLPRACAPNVFPPAPNTGTNLDAAYLLRGGVQGGDKVGGGVNLARSSATTVVVCLSDDE